MQCQNPIPSCSKGSRGLSVLPRVSGIFTGTTISPSPSLRQRPSRYTIRAGRFLADEEFRYLRNRYSYDRRLLELRFKASLPRELTNPLNLPAPGTCQSLYIALRLSRDLCFLVNSRPARFSAAPLDSTREGLHLLRASHLPKLRDHFAEFLNEGSLAHLWILSSSTCVGLRYGHLQNSHRGFSRAA